jgi:hypothetical protein
MKMGKLKAPMKNELQILFYTLCDGLRHEVRQRTLVNLATGQDFSIVDEREIGIASLMALHLRSLGLTVQLDAYFHGDPKRRPDFGIWLPASGKYIYLELKQTAWGDDSKQYYYGNAIKEIKKLNGETDPLNQLNGLIGIGFSLSSEEMGGRLLAGFKKLSHNITSAYPYEEIGLESVDFQGMDKRASYAVVGLWFRKEW